MKENCSKAVKERFEFITVYNVKDRETNNGTFGIFSSRRQAEDFVKKMEADDIASGDYTDDYYQIVKEKRKLFKL